MGTSIPLNEKQREALEVLKKEHKLGSNREVLNYLLENNSKAQITQPEPKQEAAQEKEEPKQEHMSEQDLEKTYDAMWKHALGCRDCLVVLDRTGQKHGFELLDLTGAHKDV